MLKTFQAPPFEEFGGEKNLAFAMQEGGLKIEPPQPGGHAGSIAKAKVRALEFAESYRSQGFRLGPLGAGGLRADSFTVLEREFIQGLDVRLFLGTDQTHSPLRLQVKNEAGEIIAQGDSGGPLEFQTTYDGRYKIMVHSSRDDVQGLFAIHGAFRPSVLKAVRTHKQLADKTSTPVPETIAGAGGLPAPGKTSLPSPSTVKPDHLTHDQAAARLEELKQRGYAAASLVDKSKSLVSGGKLVVRVKLLKGVEVQAVMGADGWDPKGTLEIDDAEGWPVTSLGMAFNHEFKEVVVVSSGITRRLYTPRQGVVKFTAPYTGEYRLRMNLRENWNGAKAFLGVAYLEQK